MKLNPRQLILKLLLSTEHEPLSAREAVASCALFGMRENSVRVALVRLSAAHMIEADGRGTYRIGPSAAELAREVRSWRKAEARVRSWHGGFVAVHSGALGRRDRVALRRREQALQLLGFCELDRGLFIRPDNLVGGVAAVRERLLKLGLDPEAAVFVANNFDPAREARAERLWNGRTLTKSYVLMRQQLEAWLARAPELELEVAARESFLLGNKAIRQVVFDPLLPDPLVDVGERRAFVEATLRYDQAGHAIWRKFLAPLRNDHQGSMASAHH